MNPVDHFEALLVGQGASCVREMHVAALAASTSSLLEFLALRWSWHYDREVDLLREIDADARSFLWKVAEGGSGIGLVELRDTEVAPSGVRRAETPPYCLCQVPERESQWQAGEVVPLFQEEFKTRLVGQGVGTNAAYLLAGALAEMSSNAAEHARAPILALAGFAVGAAEWSFAVADVGRGLLASLQRNPAYAGLGHERAALEMALKPGVSATGDPARGNGFGDLFRALVDRECTLRMRSGPAIAAWSGRSPTRQAVTWLAGTMPLRGFSVGVAGRI